MTEKIKLNPNNLNLRTNCYWYPCHQGISAEEYDCRMCYCPMYDECSKNNNTTYGGYWLEYIDINGENKKVWACEKCTIVHTKSFVEEYINSKKK